jgi:hypothetical protein
MEEQLLKKKTEREREREREREKVAGRGETKLLHCKRWIADM